MSHLILVGLSPSSVVLVVFCQLDISGTYVERATPIEKMPPSHWPVGKSVGCFLN